MEGKNVLIIYSHSESQSFCSVMKNIIANTLTSNGYQVKITDLYAIKFFKPLLPSDFNHIVNKEHFKPQFEQIEANKTPDFAHFTDEVKAEHQKLNWCNFLLLVFPLYWMEMPGLLKNWIDRVFSSGFAYARDKKFENGPMKGKKAMIIANAGSSMEYLKSINLWDALNITLNKATLNFCGFTTLRPFYAFEAAESEELRKKYLDELKLMFSDPQKIPELKL